MWRPAQRVDRVCVTCGALYDAAVTSKRTVCEHCWFMLPGNAWLRCGLATLEIERAAEREQLAARGQA